MKVWPPLTDEQRAAISAEQRRINREAIRRLAIEMPLTPKSPTELQTRPGSIYWTIVEMLRVDHPELFRHRGQK